MFEKIFGIFRKGKKDDFSAAIPGDTEDEDMFDMGDTGMDDDFDADTISLETGMSDGGFSSDPSAPTAASDPELGDSFGDLGAPGDDDMGEAAIGLDEADADLGAFDEPISPPPDVEPLDEEPYAPPKAKKSKKGILVTVALVIVGLLAGFFLASPGSVEMVKRTVSSQPTVLEQIETLGVENADLNSKLKAYHSVGTVDEILAIKAELKKRAQISQNIDSIESKIADRPAVEDKLDSTSSRFDQIKRALVIEQGRLANIEKSLKQIEARNDYLISSTRASLDSIAETTEKSEGLKARLDDESIERAAEAATMSRDVQESARDNAFEALSSL